MVRLWLAFIVVMVGCFQPESSVRAAQTSSTSSRPVPTVSASSKTATPSIESPPVFASAAAGPAYVLVNHSGVLQITETGSLTVFPVPKEKSSSFTEIAVSPTGHLWLSDFQGIRVRSPKGENSANRTVKDGPLYEKLIVLSDRDAWAVTRDIEWRIVHYDGATWKDVRHRSQFPGNFDDNNFSGLAVTTEGVWVASWNGV